MSTRNEYSGSAGKVVQVGEVKGDVHITYARNDHVGVDLRHEDREVHLRVGAEERFYVTVINRSDRARQLGFRVEGATGLQWEIVSDRADAGSLPADGEIQLDLMVRCTSTAPMAGAAEVKVLVGDAAERIWWPSNPKPIFVEPAPRLEATLGERDARVSDPGTYEITVRLANEGNTPLPVDMVTFTDFDGLEHPEWLDSTRVRVVNGPSFTLGYGDPPVDCLIEISLPNQAVLDKTWNIPLRAQVKRDDASPTEQSFTILQHGVVSDLIEWGRTEETRERRTLAAWAALPLAMGIGFGTMIGGPPSTPESPSVQAGSATFSASVEAPPPSQDAVRYSAMPCDPGTSVLILHSFNTAIGPAELTAIMDFEAEWAAQRGQRFEELARQKVSVTARESMCPATVVTTKPEFTSFVWIGPFPSQHARAMCEALNKIAVQQGCIPASVT